MDDSLYLELVILLDNLVSSLVNQYHSAPLMKDEDLLEFEQIALPIASLHIPLTDYVMVLHLDHLSLRAQVGVLIIGHSCCDWMGEGGRGDLDGQVLRVDLEGTARGRGEGGGRGLGERELAAGEAADGAVGVQQTFLLLLHAHVEGYY